MVDRHASGRHDHSQALWQLLVLEGFLAGMAGTRAQPAVIEA
jgi:asparagine synthase (glutamine-hydrolysing)